MALRQVIDYLQSSQDMFYLIEHIRIDRSLIFMKCADPQKVGLGEFSCGKCMPCRINHQRRWLGRALLESLCHTYTWFATLTYAPEAEPMVRLEDGNMGGTLEKADVQKWFKRCRTAGYKFRYLVVGEYGDRTWRPHYHVIIYGPSHDQIDGMLDLWGYGFTQVNICTVGGMRYALGYTLKKMTRKHDERLRGRAPEFMLASRRPALGWPGMKYLIEPYETKNGALVLAEDGDIKRTYRVDGQILPLEYRMAQYIRGLLGVPTSAEDRPVFDYHDETTLKQAQELDAKIRRRMGQGKSL